MDWDSSLINKKELTFVRVLDDDDAYFCINEPAVGLMEQLSSLFTQNNWL
jgi:hypothetical protein